MKKSRKNTVRLGIYIASGIVLFIVAIYIIGSSKNLFQVNVKVTALFEDVKGLKVGANIRFTGIDVGTVTKTVILSDSAVMVELAIQDKVTPFIKKGTVATIASEGLMGSKIIVLLPGSPDEESIEKGDVLATMEAVEIDDILREIKVSSERISEVSYNLIDITDKMNRGEGIFGKIFTDTAFAYNLSQSSKNLEEISDRVNRGEGLIGRLFADTLFSNNLDSAAMSMADISTNLEDITDKINRGEGVFGSLFTDTTLTSNIYAASQSLNSSSKNLEELTAGMIEITDKINHGQGAINKLLVDSVFADSLDITLHQLNKTIIEVEEASAALQRSGLVRAFSKKDKKE